MTPWDRIKSAKVATPIAKLIPEGVPQNFVICRQICCPIIT